MFNSSPREEQVDPFTTELQSALFGALQSVTKVPATDPFPSYYPPLAPRLADAGVAGGASRLGSKIAPGESVTLFGANLGPRQGAGFTIANGRVATELAGVAVLFNGVPAPLLYVSSEQIDAVAPALLAGSQQARVEVIYHGVRSASLHVEVQPAAPGLFTLSGNGRGYAAVLNSDGTVNSEHKPAARGGILALFGSGAGTMLPAIDDGTIVPGADHHPRLPIEVSIGGIAAEVVYSGGAPGLVAGIWQLNVRVRANAPGGMAPVEVAIGGARSRQGVYVQVE